MKKVGLVTLYEADNFGTCLQAFALQKKIESYGFNCEIIRFDRNVALQQISKVNKVRNLGIRRTMDILLSRKTIQSQKVKFSRFRKKNFKYSQFLYSSVAEVNNADLQYDAFVTGSDMVWSWESRKFLDYYFLKFANPGKRISYAPSFGNTNFDEDMQKYYVEAVSGIDYCSCREEKGKRFVNDVLKKDCILTVDPTLLISKDNWNKLIPSILRRKKNILIYMFGEIPKETFKKIQMFAKNDYTIRYIPQMYYQYRYEKKQGNAAFGPVEFLEAFHNASFVITNTYHGLMFSLIYRKPFIMYHRDREEHWNIHEERMQSVLNILDLQDRYLHFNEALRGDFLCLDYRKVDSVLNKQIAISEDYLINSLKLATGGGIGT